MKWFSRFFALYLLALTCIPCSDGDHQHLAAQEGTSNSVVTTAGDPAGHSQCSDICSPFCGCQCCTTVYTIRAFVAIPLHKVNPPATRQIFPALQFRIDDVALAIDRPPQLFG